MFVKNCYMNILMKFRRFDKSNKIKIENQYLRALAFQLYENNGVLKRKNIDEIIKLISKKRERLWYGIKIGRYHIFYQKC